MASWRDDAVCAEIDQDMFFPELGDNARIPRKVCNEMCRAREACLEAAMTEERGLSRAHRFGIRGGSGPAQRAALAVSRGEVIQSDEAVA